LILFFDKKFLCDVKSIGFVKLQVKQNYITPALGITERKKQLNLLFILGVKREDISILDNKFRNKKESNYE